MDRSVPPTSILAITFTTAAAAALRRRLESVLGGAATQVDIRTFHSFGLRVIRSWSEELGFGQFPPAVYGRDDARDVLREAANELGLAVAHEPIPRETRDPWALSLLQLERAVERYRLQNARGDSTPVDSEILDGEVLAEVSLVYERRLEARAAVDYPSMLTLPMRLLDENPRASRMLQDAYRWLLVDEYQDCCRLQAALLQRLVAQHQNLAVVGDPLQSVFRFRGADRRLLMDFSSMFPGARTFVLEQNHRSTRTIVELANALAAPLGERPASWTRNPDGPPGRLYAAVDDADEARFIAEEVARLLAAGELVQPGQAAVLFRTNAQALAVAFALRARGIPARLRAELDLFACPEVRDLIAYLRLVHSPSDAPALGRIINTPPRRLRAVEHAFRKQPVPVADLPEWAHRRSGAAGRAAAQDLLSLINDLHAVAGNGRAVDALDVVLARTGYVSWLESSERGRTHLEHVKALHGLVVKSEAPDLATWLADLHLDDVDSGVADDRAVPLLTVHGSKGREWPVVFVAGWEGLLPLNASPSRSADEPADDEERRLAYVALSRSQVQVYLTWCRSRLRGGEGQEPRREPRRPSRYLRAMPADLLRPAAGGR